MSFRCFFILVMSFQKPVPRLVGNKPNMATQCVPGNIIQFGLSRGLLTQIDLLI